MSETWALILGLYDKQAKLEQQNLFKNRLMNDMAQLIKKQKKNQAEFRLVNGLDNKHYMSLKNKPISY